MKRQIKFSLLFFILTITTAQIIAQDSTTPKDNNPLDKRNMYVKKNAESKLLEAIFVPSAIATRNVVLKEKLKLSNMHINGIPISFWAAFYSIDDKAFVENNDCIFDRELTVRILFSLGADINMVANRPAENIPIIGYDPYDFTFMGNAIRMGNFFFIRIALDEKELNIKWTDKDNNSYLHMLVDSKYKTIHTDMYANFQVVKKNNSFAIPNDNAFAELAKIMKAREQTLDNNGLTQNVEQEVFINDVLFSFINRGAEVNHQNKDGDTALHLAIRGYILFESLKTRICDVDHSKKKSITYGEYYASALINLPLAIRELLAAGADVNIKNNNGESPLDLANSITENRNPIRIMFRLAARGLKPDNAQATRKKLNIQEKIEKKEEVVKDSNPEINKEKEEEKETNNKRPNRQPRKNRPRLHIDLKE